VFSVTKKTPTPITIDLPTARRFVLLATGLVEPHANLATALTHHGFIQIDPINVCGRMHEHIARNRVLDYRHGDLHRHLHGLSDDAPTGTPALPAEQRTAFEHFHPGRIVLAAFPAEAWPYLQPIMRLRARYPGSWGGQLDPAQRRLATRILREITERGALASEDIDHHARSHNGWTNARATKVVMDKLFAHGRLLIARRLHGRRVYDLPERILPEAVRHARRPTPRATARWQAELKLRQHRLVTLKRDELPLVTSLVQPLEVPDGPPLYCLRNDLPLLEQARSGTSPLPAEPRLLAPLDPLILDRTILRRLWDFDYTWEVYTPAAKRRRGYYALPLLTGDRIVGDVDLKADREAGRLQVVSRRVARGHRSAAAVAELARFLDLK
jgi:uncharacterized protein YcaQ